MNPLVSGSTISAAAVPGTTAVSASSAVRIPAAKRAPMRGACFVESAVSLRAPAARNNRPGRRS